MSLPDPSTLRQKDLVYGMAHAGTLRLLHSAAPGLDNEEFQAAYLEVFSIVAGLLLTYIALEYRPVRLPEPSAN
jgi:hypothetical protein